MPAPLSTCLRSFQRSTALQLLASLIFFFIAVVPQQAQTQDATDQYQISVLTCGPGADLYTLFGHSALRVYNLETDQDTVYNWGTFDFGKPGLLNSIKFGVTFLTGKLPYKLDDTTNARFLREYQYYKRFVDEQVLDLTPAQTTELLQLIQTNLQPKNQYYKYDFYFDNCTTRIRDILESAVGDQLQFPTEVLQPLTFREMLHSHLGQSPWVKFGMDLILGTSSDMQTDVRQQMFLPLFFRDYLEDSVTDGYPVVKRTRKLLQFESEEVRSTFLSPWMMALGLLIIEVVAFFLIYISGDRGIFKYLDRLWFYALSIVGLMMLIMWFCTDHAVCRHNYNLLWAFPFGAIPFFLRVDRRKSWLLLTLIASAIVAIGWSALPQELPPATILIAWITVLKCLRHLDIHKWLDARLFRRSKLVVTLCFFLAIGLQAQEKIAGITMVAPPKPFDGDPTEEMIEVYANWVALVPYGFSRVGEPTVHHGSNHWWGETEEGIRASVELAHAKGLKVMLKPQVWIPGGWIGEMDFIKEEDWKTWEESYHTYIMGYAKLAAEYNIALFCIGTEYRISVSKREDFWRQLITDVKKIYSGQITYSANWDSYQEVPIWDALDFIGISAYFPLTEMDTPPAMLLHYKWKKYAKQLRKYYHKHNKPILFTEYGYLSVDGAAGPTWELEKKVMSLDINEKAQANALDAILATFWDKDYWAGGFLWKWFPEGMGHEGYPERDYTPQDKKAQSVLAGWYSKR